MCLFQIKIRIIKFAFDVHRLAFLSLLKPSVTTLASFIPSFFDAMCLAFEASCLNFVPYYGELPEATH